MSAAYCSQVRAGCISGTSNYSDVGLKRSRHFPNNDWEGKCCTYHRLWLSGDIWRCSNSQNSSGKHRGWALHVPSPAHTLCSPVPVDVPAWALWFGSGMHFWRESPARPCVLWFRVPGGHTLLSDDAKPDRQLRVAALVVPWLWGTQASTNLK